MNNRWVLFGCVLCLAGCHHNCSPLDDYLRGEHAIEIGVYGSRADSLFHLQNKICGNNVFFLVTDPSCSACIASAIDLYDLFQRYSNKESELYYYLVGENKELFDFYFYKSNPDYFKVLSDHVFLSSNCFGLPRGLYIIDNNIVQSYSLW